jgi:dTDP-glucose 4,6-dehydratase
MRKLTNILVTGGAGFIGVNFIRFLFGETEEKPEFEGRIINLDNLTYAGNAGSLKNIKEKFGGTRYFFERGDICDHSLVENLFQEYEIDTVVHFAAESHVDRSIFGPETFVKTNVLGTFTLLECARSAWKNSNDVLFHHISTDEVYGSLGETGCFTENTTYNPRSPYSASKAASDHLVMAYHHTYGMPVTISNCSNNYGPYQFPEKLIPLMIMNILENKLLPVYGDGKNIRDWVYVDDHNNAVWTIMQKGKTGERYNIGGANELENIKLIHELIDIVAAKTNTNAEAIRKTITYVKDRPGHDRRYAIDCFKIKKELGWDHTVNFNQGIERTVDWYLANREWIDNIRNGHYKRWIEKNYENR